MVIVGKHPTKTGVHQEVTNNKMILLPIMVEIKVFPLGNVWGIEIYKQLTVRVKAFQ